MIQKMEDSKGIEINYLVSKSLDQVYSKQNHISENNNKLLRRSYCSSKVDFHENDCIARSINGEVISESESDIAEDTVTALEPISTEGRALIQKKRREIQRTKSEE